MKCTMNLIQKTKQEEAFIIEVIDYLKHKKVVVIKIIFLHQLPSGFVYEIHSANIFFYTQG